FLCCLADRRRFLRLLGVVLLSEQGFLQRLRQAVLHALEFDIFAIVFFHLVGWFRFGGFIVGRGRRLVRFCIDGLVGLWRVRWFAFLAKHRRKPVFWTRGHSSFLVGVHVTSQ